MCIYLAVHKLFELISLPIDRIVHTLLKYSGPGKIAAHARVARAPQWVSPREWQLYTPILLTQVCVVQMAGLASGKRNPFEELTHAITERRSGQR